MSRWFGRLADKANAWLGHPLTFIACSLWIVAMCLWGWSSGWGSLWGLVTGSATGLISILLLCLLQHSSNRGNAALHAKLDILIAAKRSAPNDAIGAEERSEAEIRALKETAIAKVSEHD